MPANEQTWRNSRLLHVLFALSGVAMLGTTIWMLAIDHYREWKDYQRAFQHLESATIQSKINEQDTAGYQRETQKLADAVEQTKSGVPEPAIIERFEISMLFHRLRQAERAKAEADPNAPRTDATAATQLELDYGRVRAHEATAEDRAKFIESLKARDPHRVDAEIDKIQADYDALAKADESGRRPAREQLLKDMRAEIERAVFDETNTAAVTKVARAKFDKARADYELSVGENASPQRLEGLEKTVKDAENRVAEATADSQASKTYRMDLEFTTREVTADEDAAAKALDAQNGKLQQLDKLLYARAPNAGKSLLELPVLDAFNSPLKIEQIWLPKLTHPYYNFGRDTARFDRCTTCHLGMEKTAVGSAVAPLYPAAHPLAISLPTPSEPPKLEDDPKRTEKQRLAMVLEKAYGIQLSPGWITPSDVTVNVVWPGTPAALAGLEPGDILKQVGGVTVLDENRAVLALTGTVTWGQPISLQIQRGVPEPYATHPRLDLYVGSMSPHQLAKVGCTSCHQGQGSGTSFQWASHSPNTPQQAETWETNHNWSFNHDWIVPMMPKRFQQSTCIRCHHDVVDLEPSERFPEPPAPKVVEGYNIVRRYGCFGCHEINGFDGPTRRIGPDLRAEPNFTQAAAQLSAEPNFAKLPKETRGWINDVIHHPDQDAPRRRLREFLLTDAASKTPLLSGEADKLESVLKDVEAPGTFRKVGPSLRHVGTKLDFAFLYSWIRNPKDFRPTTRMPRFFGQWDHLDPGSAGLHEAQKFEPIEIRAAAEYLLASSQPLDQIKPPASVTQQASAERGKEVFTTRGCLACHQATDKDLPVGKAVQGPDLSRIGAKLRQHPDGLEGGRKWVYSWVRDPQRYHSRSLMPNLFLEPITDASGVTDPAADVAAYLLTLTGENEKAADGAQGKAWQPVDVPSRTMSDDDLKAARELALSHLTDKFPAERAERYLNEGIPAVRAPEIKGDEQLLLVTNPGDAKSRMLLYLGRRTISKYGCAACHDIPGFEDAKPIGTALADWGRKESSKLAFEQIAEYVLTHGKHGSNPHAAAGKKAEPAAEGEAEIPNFARAEDQDRAYFVEKLLGHQREGFLWQKLHEPRSYDFKKTENKHYNERLRMPKFNLDDQEIEAVMTFVLGLVSDPPPSAYIYQPEPRQAAIVEGRRVLEKFNCVGCHTLRMDRWDIEYQPATGPDSPGDIKKPPHSADDYAFMLPHFTPKQIEESLKTDGRGRRHAVIAAMPARDDATMKDMLLNEDGELLTEDDTGPPALRQVVLWEPTLLDGNEWLTGDNVRIPLLNRRVTHVAPQGGDLARLIFEHVVKAERKNNPNQKSMEAWGWLPPPLEGEGRKVQSAWLYNFLLAPYSIRPAAVLRMPRFNMSSGEASALVNYFAAIDGAEYPYQPAGVNSTTAASVQPSATEPTPFSEPAAVPPSGAKQPEGEQQPDWRQALTIVTDNNYCIKCHKVGDFAPKGSVRAMAPNLERVHERLRTDYVHDWIGRPSRILPYTAMPQNIPPSKPVDQKLYPGDSEQQLSALVELLMNFNRLAQEKFSIKPLVKEPVAPPAGTAPK